MARTGYTRTSALGPISAFLARRGVSDEEVFDRAGVPIGILDYPDLPLRLTDHYRILGAAARASADPVFGANLGRQVRTLHLSAYGRWVTGADTLAKALDRANSALNRHMQTDTDLVLIPMGGRLLWSMIFHTRGHQGRYQNELLALGYLMDTLRFFLGEAWTPDLVRVIGQDRRRNAALEEIYRAPVRGGYGSCGIEFTPPVLAALRSEGMAPALEAWPDAASRDVPDDTQSLAAIEIAVQQEVLGGPLSVDRVASRLGMSRRSLQRRLADHNTTFSDLATRKRFARAAERLEDGDVTIACLAGELGYSDPAHFTRAFKGWSGLTPQQFRAARVLRAG